MSRWAQSTVLGSLVAVLALASPAAADIYVFADARGGIHFSDARRHEGYRLYRPAVPPVVRRGGRPRVQRSRRAWDGVIAWAGKSHGLSPGLVKAVIHAESAFDPRAISNKGAQGLMQLMPGTAQQLGVDDPFNPWQNIEAGVRYLSSLIERFDGDLSLGLAAYHAGERTVRRYSGIPPYRETRNYVRRVLTLHRRYDADFR